MNISSAAFSLIGGIIVLSHHLVLEASGRWEKVRIINCYDGDTCRIGTAGGMQLNVRLAGIDAPELGRDEADGQPFSELSKRAVNQLIAGKTVSIRQKDLDQYNRPIVEVKHKGQVVNLLLVTRGLAEAYDGPHNKVGKAKYLAAEEEAQRHKRGIWSRPDVTRAWKFRRRTRRP